MVRIRTRTLEEVDRAEATAAEAVAIVVMIVETTWLQNIHLKENKRRSYFQINNYQNRAKTNSIQEGYWHSPRIMRR